MSKPTKPKSSLANVIKERAQRPDFLPKSFIEDNTRLADEIASRPLAPLQPRSHDPAHPPIAGETPPASSPLASDAAALSSTRGPARARSYAQAVLTHQATEPPISVPRMPETPAPASSISPYRRDLKRVATYLSDPAKDQLRVLCFNERTSEEDLLREALDMLFKQRGLPEISFQGAPSRKPRHL